MQVQDDLLYNMLADQQFWINKFANDNLFIEYQHDHFKDWVNK